MTRVLLLTHYFAPEVGAPQSRLLALTRHLQCRGHDVTVHAPPPHYPSGVIPAPYRGRALSIWRSPEGWTVVRSAVYASPNSGTGRRLANHLSFALSALAAAPASGRQDVVVAESPPLFLAGAAVGYARIKRSSLILHVADRWPESAIALGVVDDPRLIAAARMLERRCYRSASAIVVPTPAMCGALEQIPEAAGRVHVIAPAVDIERFDPRPPAVHGPLRVIYAGTIGLAHGLDVLAAAAEIVGPDVCDVTVVGDGAAAGELRKRNGANFRVRAAVAAREVPALYAEADVGVVLLRDVALFYEALPSKLLEILAAGRPAVVACRGAAADLVVSNDAGVAVPPGDPTALAQALATLRRDPDAVARMGANGRALVERSFARPAMVRSWERVIDCVNRAHRPTP